MEFEFRLCNREEGRTKSHNTRAPPPTIRICYVYQKGRIDETREHSHGAGFWSQLSFYVYRMLSLSPGY
jgi:hypothetical protein